MINQRCVSIATLRVALTQIIVAVLFDVELARQHSMRLQLVDYSTAGMKSLGPLFLIAWWKPKGRYPPAA